MSPTDEVSNLINCLTSNEDQRQELWIYYLNGNSPLTFVLYLRKIQQEYNLDEQLQKYLLFMFNNPPSAKFHSLLNRLSEIEQSIVCLLALGLTIDQVSEYKGISRVRIKQVISIIRENDCWKEIYGT